MSVCLYRRIPLTAIKFYCDVTKFVPELYVDTDILTILTSFW